MRCFSSLSLLVSGLCWSMANAQQQHEVVHTTLLGENVRPDGVETDASGYITFIYSEENESIVWSMEIDNPNGVTFFGESGLNIRCKGSGGRIEVNLFGGGDGGGSDASLFIGRTGTITQEDMNGACLNPQSGVAALWLWLSQTDQSNLYVDVDSDTNPDGELRGELGNQAVGEADAILTVLSAASTVETEATGRATFLYNSALRSILFVMGISNPEEQGIFGGGQGGSNIYCGTPPSLERPVVQLVEGTIDTSVSISRVGSVRDDDLLNTLCVANVENLWVFMNDPVRSNTFVSVRSTDAPTGLLFGRIGGPEDSTTLPTASPTAAPPGATPEPTAAPTTEPSAGARRHTTALLICTILGALFMGAAVDQY